MSLLFGLCCLPTRRSLSLNVDRCEVKLGDLDATALVNQFGALQTLLGGIRYQRLQCVPPVDSLVLLDQSVVLLFQAARLSPVLARLLQELQEGALSLIALLDFSPEFFVNMFDSLVVIIQLVVLRDKFLIVLCIDVLVHFLECGNLVLVYSYLLSKLFHDFFLGIQLSTQVFDLFLELVSRSIELRS